eukprot:6467460-Amphidinium_carterae.1
MLTDRTSPARPGSLCALQTIEAVLLEAMQEGDDQRASCLNAALRWLLNLMQPSMHGQADAAPAVDAVMIVHHSDVCQKKAFDVWAGFASLVSVGMLLACTLVNLSLGSVMECM